MVLGTAALGFVVLAFVLAGAASAARLARAADTVEPDRGARALELASAAALLALAFAVATSWALAFAGLLTRPWLVASAVPFLAASVPMLRRVARSPAWRRTFSLPPAWWGPTGALVLVGAWTVFVLWRGTVVTPYNGDALSYHMPRAAIFVQQHGFTVPQTPEGRLASWPCDYELLLADAIALVGDDGLCGWVGTASFVALLLLCAALLARWWGWGRHVVLGTVLVATTPIAILHSGVHKNDLMQCALTVAVGFFVEPWVRRGSVRSLALALLAALLALGTKLQGLAVCAVVAPLLLWGAWKHRASPGAGRAALLVVAGVVAGVAVLGGAVYGVNLLRLHTLALPPEQKGTGYGEWANLWMYPYLAVAGPLAPRRNWLWIPWRHDYWWTPENDIMLAGFGPLFSLLILALPVAVWLGRRRGDLAGRATTSAYLLAVAALVLPVRVLPEGVILGAGRYLAFLLPVVCGWTFPPLILALERRAGRPGLVAAVASALLAAVFVREAWVCGIDDAACPWGWVAYRMEHPEDRTPHRQRWRAASGLDAVAGPEDHIAVDVGLDSWVYQLYGPKVTRTVTFLPRTDGPVPVPPDAEWVVVDRAITVLFGHPDFTDSSRWDLFGHGRPTAEETKVLRQLHADPEWVLLSYKPEWNQAVFRRRAP